MGRAARGTRIARRWQWSSFSMKNPLSSYMLTFQTTATGRALALFEAQNVCVGAEAGYRHRCGSHHEWTSHVHTLDSVPFHIQAYTLRPHFPCSEYSIGAEDNCEARSTGALARTNGGKACGILRTPWSVSRAPRPVGNLEPSGAICRGYHPEGVPPSDVGEPRPMSPLMVMPFWAAEFRAI
jgi:hypothetical protein